MADRLGILFEPQVTAHTNKSFTLQFTMRNCQKYWTSLWILIKTPSIDILDDAGSIRSNSILTVPKACFKKRGNVFWVNLPSNAKAPCAFSTLKVMECEVYNIEIIPIYYTLQGKPYKLQFTMPPEVHNIILNI